MRLIWSMYMNISISGPIMLPDRFAILLTYSTDVEGTHQNNADHTLICEGARSAWPCATSTWIHQLLVSTIIVILDSHWEWRNNYIYLIDISRIGWFLTWLARQSGALLTRLASLLHTETDQSRNMRWLQLWHNGLTNSIPWILKLR